MDINRKGQFPTMCCFVLFVFFSNSLSVNSEDPNQTPHYVASNLGLHYLSLSHKNDEKLIRANAKSFVLKEGFFHLDVLTCIN